MDFDKKYNFLQDCPKFDRGSSNWSFYNIKKEIDRPLLHCIVNANAGERLIISKTVKTLQLALRFSLDLNLWPLKRKKGVSECPFQELKKCNFQTQFVQFGAYLLRVSSTFPHLRGQGESGEDVPPQNLKKIAFLKLNLRDLEHTFWQQKFIVL